MIRIHHLEFSIRQRRILSDIHFHAAPGELISIVGPNGAGKSTLLKLIAGGLQPDSGILLIDGIPIDSYQPAQLARKRAVLAQQYVVNGDFKVYDIVMMGRYCHFQQTPSRIDAEIVMEAMAMTGVADAADTPINELSGGEQQRVQMARILAQVWTDHEQNRGIILLDEPISSLDMKYQHQLLKLAHDLSNRGYTVVTVLHDLNHAARYSDRVVMMSKGCIVTDNIPELAFTGDRLSELYQVPLKTTRINGQLLIIDDPDKRLNVTTIAS